MDAGEANNVECVIRPDWQAGFTRIQGALHVVISIRHPRHGIMHFLMPESDATNLIGGITQSLQAVPAADPPTEEERGRMQ